MRSDQAILVLDDHYKYQIDRQLEGGMGQVYLLTHQSGPNQPYPTRAVYSRPFIQEEFKFPYRDKLAVKMIKDPALARDFVRECLIWLDINEVGMVPLLKVANIQGRTGALMPRYQGNLRELFGKGIRGREVIKLLKNPILGLSKVFEQMRLVHQDIKPENLLYCRVDRPEGTGNKPVLFLSDWGIANVQADILSRIKPVSSRFTFQTMSGFGTLPYMAPERLLGLSSRASADIFSLGMIFVEALAGTLPYQQTKSIEEQLISGEYHLIAKDLLANQERKIRNSILSMIAPFNEKRVESYRDVLKFVEAV